MLADLQKLVTGLVRDEVSRLTPDEFDQAISLAIVRYAGDKPRRKVEDVIGAGGDTLPLPVAWEATSELLTAEYPIGENPPQWVGCTIYTRPTGDVLLLGDALAIGAEVRLTFTVAHVVTDVVDTVPVAHRDAVAAWAAALLLEQLAAAAINDGESTLHADTTDRRTKAQEYASRAKALKTRYAESLGLNTQQALAPASKTVAWPSRTRLTRGIIAHG